MTGVVDLNDAPRVLPGTHPPAVDLDDVLRANDGERHEPSELGILLHSIFIVFLNVVREVIDGNSVVLNVLHDELLRLSQLGGGERVGLANDGNDVDAGRQALHKLDVEFAETAAR